MSESVHGHDVMRFMIESGGFSSRDALVEAVVARFGAGTRFHTCSAEGMTAGELVDFLAARGKFIHADGNLSTRPDRICSH